MRLPSARVSRFTREVQKVAPGGAVTLRVYGNGRYREVSLKTVKSSELQSNFWQFNGGDGAIRIFRRDSGGAIEIDGHAIESSMEAVRERMRNLGRDFELQLKDFPLRMEGQGVHTLTLPRRGLIRM